MIWLHQGNGIIPWRLRPICPAAPLYSCFTSIFSAGFQPSHLHCDCILKCTQVVSRQEKYSTANRRQPERPVGRCNYPVTVKRKNLWPLQSGGCYWTFINKAIKVSVMLLHDWPPEELFHKTPEDQPEPWIHWPLFSFFLYLVLLIYCLTSVLRRFVLLYQTHISDSTQTKILVLILVKNVIATNTDSQRGCC